MLLASVMPASVMEPIVTCVTCGPEALLPRITAPEPVTVHCEVGVRWPPYSSGRRNCRSAVQKWDEATAAQRSAQPLAAKMLASDRLSAMVEQAP